VVNVCLFNRYGIFQQMGCVSERRIHDESQPVEPVLSTGVRVIKPAQFDAHTPQTPGMQRIAAISRELTGSQGIWAGVTIVAPHVASGKHHHGELEIVIYVVSGQVKIRWGKHLEHEQTVEPGDFIYVPPFVPHQEVKTSMPSIHKLEL
jgi:uncharacterized RmlC-like cupin family protein